MTQVNIYIAKAHLSELIQQALLGEEIIITKDLVTAVKFVPQLKKCKRKLGLAKGLIIISPGFDDPLDDNFK